MSDKKDKLVTTPLDYIKEWYRTEGDKLGIGMQAYATMILSDHALKNGAQEHKVEKMSSATEEVEKKPVYNDYGDIIDYK